MEIKKKNFKNSLYKILKKILILNSIQKIITNKLLKKRNKLTLRSNKIN